MAHIFKHPDKDGKGIIVFTHKEIKLFYIHNPYFNKTYGRRDKLKSYFLPPKKGFDKKILDKIRGRYYIGVHFGWFQNNYPVLEHVDFYMGSPSTTTFQSENVFYIPLDGSSFIPKAFYLEKPKSHFKYWDILMVSRDVKFKNLHLFLQTIRDLYDKGTMPRVLLLVPSNKTADSDPKITYTRLLSDYEEMFSYSEREHFTILKTHPEMPFLGMGQKQVALFYHLSKVFALYSMEEGGSRVVSEALLAGLPVVVHKDLKGGARDFLNTDNSVLFDDYSNAGDALMQALEKCETLASNNEEIAKLTREDLSLERLAEYFDQLFTKHNETFRKESLINTSMLSFKLNAHWHEGLPWADKRFKNPDILNTEQLHLFLSELH